MTASAATPVAATTGRDLIVAKLWSALKPMAPVLVFAGLARNMRIAEARLRDLVGWLNNWEPDVRREAAEELRAILEALAARTDADIRAIGKAEGLLMALQAMES